MSADAQRFATCHADEPGKRVYTPDDDILAFKRSVRFAAIDVMILTFAARRHAEWLSRIGVCPPDLAALIRKDVAYITNMLDGSTETRAAESARETATIEPAKAPAPPHVAHVGPRPQPPEAGETRTNPLFDATRANVGKSPSSPQAASLAVGNSANGSSLAIGAPDGGVNSQATPFCLLRTANTHHNPEIPTWKSSS